MPRQKRKTPPDPLLRAIVLSILLCGVLALFIATWPDAFNGDKVGAASAVPPPATAVPAATVAVPPVLGGETIENSTVGAAGSPPREGFAVVPRRVPSVVVGPDGKIISP
ncbi:MULTISPECIES: hypothetical protein [unclassified Beijerinckia]|uniref:hypothetical protein n=1 Tax=unclassified Beijerinckia TaxID=2638183 RepID=UPI000896D606|nr:MULTISPECIES: hypothetical protein [unclassified Beijerinckia]MDH7796599.1 hypothetical protein [Beijerinckia sp. GAS462]SEC51963.1 hypothetical protein SAMN05443249_2883 [Beijerinckia sp. 28-YEA-48]